MPISDSDLAWLARDHTGGLCVSLYARTHRAGREKSEDPIRLRNMIRAAERRMQRAGMRVPAIRKIIQPANDLVRRPDFWRHPDSGVVLFLAPDTQLHYHLPFHPTDTLFISRRFYLKPLLPLLAEDQSFCLLTLSLNDVNAYWGHRDGMAPVEGADFPRSLAETLPDPLPPVRLQWHTRTGETTPGGKRAAVFHGQGGAKEFRKEDILRFFRRIDRGMGRVLRNRKVPLVIAGVDYLLPIYRRANSYPRLSATLPLGNPGRSDAGVLREAAWDAVWSILAVRRTEAFRSFRRMNAEGDRRVSTDIAAILPAAFQGKVKTLFIESRAHAWGVFDPANHSIRERTAADEWAEDLFDLAAVQVRMHGGEVYIAPPARMPSKAAIAAEFRI